MAESLATTTHSRAQRALWSSPIHALRDVKVEQVDDTLILSGSVDTFYHKQLAQELVRNVADGCELMNEIDVQYAARHWEDSRGSW
jgi:hypothetical protein